MRTNPKVARHHQVLQGTLRDHMESATDNSLLQRGGVRIPHVRSFLCKALIEAGLPQTERLLLDRYEQGAQRNRQIH